MHYFDVIANHNMTCTKFGINVIAGAVFQMFKSWKRYEAEIHELTNEPAGAMLGPEDEEAAVQLEADNDISRNELSEDQAVEVKKLLLNFQVGRIVVDEAHFAKNPKSTLNQMICMISHDELYLASATMLSNSIRDFLGYIELMWRPELPFDYDPATRATPPSTFYDPSTWKQLVQGINTRRSSQVEA
ncbi:hypothetical protein FCOIX_2289 [Fusarium coicis]|nr:hypothetical protein FCOIX_2289 [Fusarium coicis]